MSDTVIDAAQMVATAEDKDKSVAAALDYEPLPERKINIKKTNAYIPTEPLQLGPGCRISFKQNHGEHGGRKKIYADFLYVDDEQGKSRFEYRDVTVNSAFIFRCKIDGETFIFTRPTTMFQSILAKSRHEEKSTKTGKGWEPYEVKLDKKDERGKPIKVSLIEYRPTVMRPNAPGFKNDPTITKEQRDAWCDEARKLYEKIRFVHKLSEIDDLLSKGFLPDQIKDELSRLEKIAKLSKDLFTKDTDVDQKEIQKKIVRLQTTSLKGRRTLLPEKRKRKDMDLSTDEERMVKRKKMVDETLQIAELIRHHKDFTMNWIRDIPNHIDRLHEACRNFLVGHPTWNDTILCLALSLLGSVDYYYCQSQAEMELLGLQAIEHATQFVIQQGWTSSSSCVLGNIKAEPTF